jgi:tetratricopeptide (TPR) repeat protein
MLSEVNLMFLKKGAALLAIGVLGIMLVAGCRTPELEGGIVHLNAGRFDEAIKQFEIALQNDPNNPEIYLYLAKAYANKKDFNQANIELNTAQEKDTGGKFAKKIAGAREEIWYKVYDDFALVEFGQKNFAQALEYFQLCIQLDPAKKESFFGAGATATLLSQDKNAEVAALEDQMKNPELTAEQVEQLKSQVSALDEEITKLHLLAVDMYEKALAMDPESLDYMTDLSSAYLDAGMLDKAAALLEKLVAKNPTNPDIFYKVARSHHLAIAEDKDNATLHLQKAKEYYQKTIDLDPTYSDAMYYLGTLYMDNDQDYANAVKYFEDYIKLVPEDKVAWARLAQCYGKLGEEEKAIEAAKKLDELEKAGK